VKISIVIPAYNEEQTLAAVIQRIQSVSLEGVEKEIIVVDDASTDQTAEVLKSLQNIRAIRHSRNAGKGAALTTGIRASTGDVVIFQDADLEYAPEDYPVVLQPLIEGRCDAVMGSRFLRERPIFWGSRKSPYFNHYMGNLLIIWCTNILYGKQFTDYEGCYKAFRRPLLLDTPIEATGFEFDNELICKVMRKGAHIAEVPIQYHPRTYAQGKKITWRHGLVMLWTIVKWRLLPLPASHAAIDHRMAA